MEVSSALLRGAARLLADSKVYAAAFRGSGQAIRTKQLNKGRTAMVELELRLPEPLLDAEHYAVVDPRKLLEALKAAGPRARLEASGGKVLVDGQEVGEVYRVGEGPGLNPRVQEGTGGYVQVTVEPDLPMWEEPPSPNLHEVAVVEAGRGDSLRSFLAALKDRGHYRVFLGARGRRAYVGFWLGWMEGFVSYDGEGFEGGLRVVSQVAPAATVVGAERLLAAMPLEWFRGSRSPRVQLALASSPRGEQFGMPMYVRYEYDAGGGEGARVGYWLAPDLEREEGPKLAVELLDRSPVSWEAPLRALDKVLATYTISFEDAEMIDDFFDAVLRGKMGAALIHVAGEELRLYAGSWRALVKVSGISPVELATKPEWSDRWGEARLYKVEWRDWQPGLWKPLKFFSGAERGVPLSFGADGAYLWLDRVGRPTSLGGESWLAEALKPFEMAEGAPALRGRADAGHLRRVARAAAEASRPARGRRGGGSFVIFTADGRLHAAGWAGEDWQVREAGRWQVYESPPGAPSYTFIEPRLLERLLSWSAPGPVEVTVVPARGHAERPPVVLRFEVALPSGRRSVEAYYVPPGAWYGGLPDEVLRRAAGLREGEEEGAPA